MQDDLIIPDDERTTYSIRDENGCKSSITIEKWAADILQETMGDGVHVWIQERYILVCQKHSHLTRREKGNLVRRIANRKAEENTSKKFIADLL